ncbi:MAG: helix-turn-helix domain-containing protein [Marinilabiliaceae bacterium]|nr:helix-turn-helix domain-containing protein [Marinilabiliaceae bacterium]
MVEPQIMISIQNKHFHAFFVQSTIHLGKIIKQKFDETSMNISEFAEKIHVHRTNVNNIFKRKSINSELLFEISKALNFDFYNEIYLDKRTDNFSKKVLIAFEIDESKIDKLGLSMEQIYLLKNLGGYAD